MDIIPQRIAVVGVTGSGKTTLAQDLSKILSIPHIELDSIFWQENWVPLPVEEFRKIISQKVEGNTWIIDGNYGKVRDIIWQKADTIIWLDYGFWRIFYQLFQRTLQRVFLKEKLWNDNREHFRSQFLSTDSLFIWAIKTYPKRKKLYPELFGKFEFAHLNIIRLNSPQETRKWVSELDSIIQRPQL